MVLHDETWHQDVDGSVRSLRGEPVVPIRQNRRRMIVGAMALALAILAAAVVVGNGQGTGGIERVGTATHTRIGGSL